MSYRPVLAATMLAVAAAAPANVIGTNQPSPGLTAARIAALPPAERAAWSRYLARSQRQEAADRAVLAAERRSGGTVPPVPATGNGEATMPLDRDAAWYAGPQATHVADVIVSFQTPAGGWGKNQPRDGALRQRAQAYVGDNRLVHPGLADFDQARDDDWHYVGTLDNDATVTELRFLARVATARPGAAGEAYRRSVLHGIDYLLAAQFPNGGWPQVWPLEGGYHDSITFNDNAVANVLTLLSAVAAGKGEYAFVPAAVRARADAAVARGNACILRTQLVVAGHRTGWGQQHDPLTLRPGSGRNYEPPALASSESAGLVAYLLGLPRRTPAVTQAIDGGVAWLRAVAVPDRDWRDPGDGGGRRLLVAPGASPVWARYYDLDTGKPIFGDRDKSIHDTVDDLSAGRRHAYSWYVVTPGAVLARVDKASR